ncbi:hypothetical protein GCM10010510_45570 [Streptomyces anandii JCM 4720]|nr:hypothetical protein GCM10010510_45570 [Streptomyces anandii JCM 4720]
MTSVIRPLLSVMRTWTGPQRVCTVSPVTVLVPEVLPPDDEPDDEPLDDDPPEPADEFEPLDAAGAGAAAISGGVCGLSDSSITSPETVAALASTTRRSGLLFFNACTNASQFWAQSSNDSWWTRRSGTPAARSTSYRSWAKACGPQM